WYSHSVPGLIRGNFPNICANDFAAIKTKVTGSVQKLWSALAALQNAYFDIKSTPQKFVAWLQIPCTPADWWLLET
ncbi:hypothetical protein J6590_070091, partial [Homalodisca vitripennis]